MGYIIYSFISVSLHGQILKMRPRGFQCSFVFTMNAEGSALLPYNIHKCKSNGEMLGEDRVILLYPSFFHSE